MTARESRCSRLELRLATALAALGLLLSLSALAASEAAVDSSAVAVELSTVEASLKRETARRSVSSSSALVFVGEMLRELSAEALASQSGSKLESRGSTSEIVSELLDALDASAAGAVVEAQTVADLLREWLSLIGSPNSLGFGAGSTGEQQLLLQTGDEQLLVSKLALVNCGAIFRPQWKLAAQLMPRFLLFNQHFDEIPVELAINSSRDELLRLAGFEPRLNTVLLVHGFLSGFGLGDSLEHIKDRLLDLRDRNVIIVDWFVGANPEPTRSYVRAAANAQIVGSQIAQFLANLAAQSGASLRNMHIIAHSLGCHVTGFAGKALRRNFNMTVGQITQLDPVGTCFGPLLGGPELRLAADDAHYTAAVHVARNLFGNPLDAAHSNFLVNGGSDQLGCGGSLSELRNFTSSGLALLWNPNVRFAPCSHLRALMLFEGDYSRTSGSASGSASEAARRRTGRCQLVGVECASYGAFLDGACSCGEAAAGADSPAAGKCRLLSLPEQGYEADESAREDAASKLAPASRQLFLGTSSVPPFCLDFYQLRVLFDRRELLQLAARDALAANQNGDGRRTTLQLAMKAVDARGGYLRGMTLVADVRDLRPAAGLAEQSGSLSAHHSPQFVETTMLLNATADSSGPALVERVLVKCHLHALVVPRQVQFNYLSNVSPKVRHKHSSKLCVARKNSELRMARLEASACAGSSL